MTEWSLQLKLRKEQSKQSMKKGQAWRHHLGGKGKSRSSSATEQVQNQPGLHETLFQNPERNDK